MVKLIPGGYVEYYGKLSLIHCVGSDYLIVSEVFSENGLATIKVDKVMRAGVYTYTYDRNQLTINTLKLTINTLKDSNGKVITLTKFK